MTPAPKGAVWTKCVDRAGVRPGGTVIILSGIPCVTRMSSTLFPHKGTEGRAAGPQCTQLREEEGSGRASQHREAGEACPRSQSPWASPSMPAPAPHLPPRWLVLPLVPFTQELARLP